MNTGTYGSHFEKGALYLSLARGVTYCAHPIQERPLIPYDRFTKKIDQGETTYSFRLGVVDNDALERETQIFTQKPYGLNVYPLTNPQTAEPFSFSLADASVAVITVKKADDREAMLIRLHNNTDHAVDTALTVNGVTLPLSFGCYEVKTVQWDKQGLIELDHLAI
jgi:alpha-mannosidase